MTVRATEDMTQSAETVLYLDVGNYTIINLDNSLNNFTLSAATETDFNTVTVEDLSASIQVGVKYGHLSIAVTGENETAMTFHTCNASGQENEIELTADYAKIYASTDLATLVETTVSSITGNGEEIELTQNELNPEIYFGSVGQLIPTSARETYDGSTAVRLSTDITELVEDTFTLTANITGAGEAAVVYAASYDAVGKMTAIHSWETQAGKTKYPFTIEAGTAEVKIYVLDKESHRPLIEVLSIR